MYEELVKRLREIHPEEFGDAWDFAFACQQSMHEAADAIEELQRTQMSSTKWIPVEERLPDSGVHVLASCRSYGGCRYVCDAFYSAPKTEVCSYNDEIDMEYDEETDEYYMPEGWWEVIKNWDEYSCIGIEDTVTHWMPLPESPEGER